ncbi:MAG: rod shape-determining protein MreC [Ruminococcus sp.]|nr:rod shape-determining protein MreC [Ruminococcus sp.]
MGNFLKSTKCKIILCILALLIGIMIYAVSQGGYTISSIGIFKSIAAPFQRASNAISEQVEHVLELYVNADDCYRENQALKEEIAILHAELADYEATKDELAELKEFVGIKEKHKDFTLTSPFDVVGYVTNDPYGTFMINGGTEHGVELYAPVVTEQGMVGIITEVGDETATVTTILSPEVFISAGSSTLRETGVVTGSVALLKYGYCKLDYLDKETRLRKGQAIVTTGENGHFPKGYIIGYVQEIEQDAAGMTAYATVDPAVDLSNLSKVVVIADFEGKEERDEAR